ncbi:hypothetical protein NZD88_12880 [Chryseobacterium antibioticum]|uniref:PBCV-specific basic adaptor domain-containing protein n=1 Tax=Chryseobacterium pyrolae TaxID=2987481 RepID=A0ABT2IIR4_9FLAO|nr:hypothetical protein [Chryseobacterium pyrolae]MCT2408437.1 hypothetical protein [Chryseobacterium pyrolae]
MKKLLFTALLAAGLMLPSSFTATGNTTISKTELSSKKQKKKAKKSKSSSNSSSKRSKSYSQSRGCTYNGSQLYVGKRGGCYYYTGSSKQYVDRSYCSGCN